MTSDPTAGDELRAAPLDPASRTERMTILLALLDQNRQETVFWRDRTWSVFRSAVVAFATIASVSILKEGKLPATLFGGYYVLVMIASTGANNHLRANQAKHADLRRERERILRALGVTEDAVAGEEGTPNMPIIVTETGHPDAFPAFGRLIVLMAVALTFALFVQYALALDK